MALIKPNLLLEQKDQEFEKYAKYNEGLYDITTEVYKSFSRNFIKKVKYVSGSIKSRLTSQVCKDVKSQPNFDIKKLINTSNSKFYKQAFFEMLSCYASINLTMLDNPYSNVLNIKENFGRLKALSAGTFGEVYEFLKTELRNGFVVKYAKEEYDIHGVLINHPREEVIHEMFIAKHLNKYRSQIPNFMYGYSFFSGCGSPELTLKQKIYGLCDVDGKSYYSIFEKINGMTLSKYLKAAKTGVSVLTKYLQVLLGLYTVRELKYTHNDLHTENVMIRPIGKKTVIPYTYKKKTVYLQDDGVATMIDYGLSYLEINKGKYKGKYGLTERSDSFIYPDKANQLNDSFKLFMFIIYRFFYAENQKGKDIYKYLLPIYKFFDPTGNIDKIFDLRETIDQHNDPVYFFSAPPNALYSHEKLIDFILKKYKLPIFYKPKPGFKYLKCATKTECLISFKDYLDENKRYTPYDVLKMIRGDSLVKSVEALNILKKGLSRFTDLYDNFEGLVDDIDKVVLEYEYDIKEDKPQGTLSKFVNYLIGETKKTKQQINQEIFDKVGLDLLKVHSAFHRYNDMLVLRDSLFYIYDHFGVLDEKELMKKMNVRFQKSYAKIYRLLKFFTRFSHENQILYKNEENRLKVKADKFGVLTPSKYLIRLSNEIENLLDTLNYRSGLVDIGKVV